VLFVRVHATTGGDRRTGARGALRSAPKTAARRGAKSHARLLVGSPAWPARKLPSFWVVVLPGFVCRHNFFSVGLCRWRCRDIRHCCRSC